MKDKEIRGAIITLRGRCDHLEKKIEALAVFEVKYCPKCKHDTPQIEQGGDGRWDGEAYHWIDGGHKCLVCGSLIKHGTEETHEIIKE